VTVHDLKTWPIFFDAIVDGRKPFDYRFNDRDFKVGDFLRLQEWCPKRKDYTGRWVMRKITYMVDKAPGLAVGYCIMTIERGEVGCLDVK
jgi:hypothetical protein